jgi:Bacterial Ig domain
LGSQFVAYRENVLASSNRLRASARPLIVIMVGGLVGASSLVALGAVESVTGSAAGLEVSLSGEEFAIDYGPAPVVTLPPEGGGPIDDSESSIVVPIGSPPGTEIFSVASTEVSTQGAGVGTNDGVVTSNTTLNGVIINNFLTADQISITCVSDRSGSTATVTLTNALLEGTPLPEVPEPNVAVSGVNGNVILNSQAVTETPGVGTQINVVGVLGEPAAASGITGSAALGAVECGVSGANVLKVPPVVADIAITVESGIPYVFDPVDSATDADGDVMSVDFVSQPSNGVATINSDGTVTYTSAAGFVGSDTFDVTICDASGDCATSTVDVTVVAAQVSPTTTAPPTTGSIPLPTRIDTGGGGTTGGPIALILALVGIAATSATVIAHRRRRSG